MGCMVYAVARSKEHLEEGYEPDLDGEFKPNMINSVVFLVGAVQQVRVDVYDVQGRRVRSLLDTVYGAGGHTVVWDGVDDAGGQAASGVYVVRVQAGSIEDFRKVVLIK